METHECNFPEEQEPEGRLILGPCLECGLSALDAMKQMESELKKAVREEREACAKVAENSVEYQEQIPCPDEMVGCCVYHTRTSTRHLKWLEIAQAIRQQPSGGE